MPFVRTLLAAAALAASLAGSLLLAAPAARADTLADAGKRIEALSKLVEEWIALANRDEREDDLLRYQAQTEEDFKRPKNKRVSAEQVLGLIADKSADKDLRTRAAKVLQAAAIQSADPDLAVDGRDNKKRKQWARENLVPLLTRDDEKGGDNLSRALAHDILNAWFKSEVANRDASYVANYDPAKKKTWDPAAKAWRDALR
jgi:hypothetical protein